MARIRMWLVFNAASVRKAGRICLYILAAVVVLNLALFALQRNRTPLLTKLNGKSYGLMSVDKARELLKNDHVNAKLTLSVESKTVVLGAQNSGVSVDTDKTLEKAIKRRGWEYIPMFAAVSRLLNQVQIQYYVDQEALAKALGPSIAESTKQPFDAAIKVPADAKDKITVTPSVDGSAMSSSIAAEQVAKNISREGLTLKVEPKTLVPEITTEALEDFLPAVEAARKTSMTIQANNSELELSSSVLAPLFKVVADGSKLKLSLDEDALASYLEQKAGVFYQAAVATKTVQQDGVEVSRTNGKAGTRLDAKATAALVVQDFENNTLKVTAKVEAVQPTVQATNSYSNTDAGLYALIDEFAKSHAGVYRVAAVQLTGSGSRSAFYNADTTISTASIYKMYVGYAAMKRVEEGTLTKETQTSSGTVDYCINRMIVVSDNPCGEALLSYLGASKIDQMLASNGFGATKTATSKTTARNTVNLLAKMYNHEILTKASTDYLFNFMASQVYRQGIPAGSKGAVVQDKVGFLDGLYHDAGLVYSPKGTYALVILTDGAGGFSNLKLLSQQIYDFYNQ